MISEEIQNELNRTDYRFVSLQEFSEYLKRKATEAELLLAERLSPDFLFQQPLLDYVLDFFNPHTKVCVEVDGLYHWHQYRKDNRRDCRLFNNLGVCTMRMMNEEVMSDPDAAAENIKNWRPIPPVKVAERKKARDPGVYKRKVDLDKLILRWEPRNRENVLNDFNFLKMFAEQDTEYHDKFLRSLEKRILFWPVDGYKKR